MPFPLILDILVAGLLVVTIAYAMVLNSKLGNLRRDRAELETLANSFKDATTRADDSIGKLKNMADHLQEIVNKAQSLHDDLRFLIDRGDSAADQLEETVRTARKQLHPKAGAALRDVEMPGSEAVVAKSEAERELLKALQSAR